MKMKEQHIKTFGITAKKSIKRCFSNKYPHKNVKRFQIYNLIKTRTYHSQNQQKEIKHKDQNKIYEIRSKIRTRRNSKRDGSLDKQIEETDLTGLKEIGRDCF